MLNFLMGGNAMQQWPTVGGVRPHDAHPFWFGGGRFPTKSGIDVDENTALFYSAIWCATRVLTETIGRLPKLTYERLPPTSTDRVGGKRLAFEHPVFPLVKTAPNLATTSMPFFEGQSNPLINRGNTFAEIKRIGSVPSALVPLVQEDIAEFIFDTPDGEPLYVMRREQSPGVPDVIPASNMLHVPGALPERGVWGKGVITYARETIGLAIATERHGAQFFKSGAKPSGVLKNPKSPNVLNNKEEREAFQEEYRELNSGSGTAILWKGFDYQPISISNEDAQFLKTRQFEVAEVARWYNLPVHVLKDMSAATFSNIEQQAIDYIVYSAMPWIIRWEEQLTAKLFDDQQRQRMFVEFNPDALLRGDLKSRYEAYAIGLLNGFLSINDVLRKENLNPIGPEGDGHRVPANTLPLGQNLILDTAAEIRKLIEGKTSDLSQLVAAQTETLDNVLLPAVRDGAAEAIAAVAKEVDQLRQENADRNRIEVTTADDAAQATAKCKEVARITLRDAAARMIHKEAKAAKRAANSPATFMDWLTAFYGKHAEQFSDAIANGCEAAIAAGYDADSDAIAATEWGLSDAALQDIYSTATPDDFAAAVATETDKWEATRADDIVNRIFQTETVEA